MSERQELLRIGFLYEALWKMDGELILMENT